MQSLIPFFFFHCGLITSLNIYNQQLPSRDHQARLNPDKAEWGIPPTPPLYRVYHRKRHHPGASLSLFEQVVSVILVHAA
jgi:hypothetical protein